MKRLMVSTLVMLSLSAFAAEDQGLEKKAPPIFSFYANYGFYSGYQLYGSLLNKDPVLQGYAEIRAKLLFDDWDFGSLGIGVWHNTDLTGRRANNGRHDFFCPTETRDCAISRRAFNEIDPNVSWDISFWFDDEKTVGLYYKTSFIWYWYPHDRASCDHAQYTTMDWNHYFELVNPILTPYINVVHEYHESNGNLLQFGVKHTFVLADGLTVTPFIEGVWRNRSYGWCFSNYGLDENYDKLPSGFATAKAELDVNYWFTANVGLFAKVAYCTTVDPNLRDSADFVDNSNPAHYGNSVYGAEKDFVWGGVGLQIAF